MRSLPRAATKLLVGPTLLVGLACACIDSPSPREVGCERVSLEDREYCVYRGGEQAITETGYDCPRDLAHGVSMGDGKVCTSNGEIPGRHRDDLRERIDGTDGPGVDAGSGDAGSDAANPETCTEPDSCPASSGSNPVEPSFRCHTPQRPPVGESFTLTIYGQDLAAYSDSDVEVATDTGFKRQIQVDHRCQVTVDLPDYVWDGGETFEVKLANQAGEFRFDVQGD